MATATAYLTDLIDRKTLRVIHGNIELELHSCLLERALVSRAVQDALGGSLFALSYEDLAPQNIIVDNENNIKGIIDWGLTRRLSVQLAVRFPRFLAIEPQDLKELPPQEVDKFSLAFLQLSPSLQEDRLRFISHISRKAEEPGDNTSLVIRHLIVSVLSDAQVDWRDLFFQAACSKGLHSWMAKRAWLINGTKEGWKGLIPLERTLLKEANSFLSKTAASERESCRLALENALKGGAAYNGVEARNPKDPRVLDESEMLLEECNVVVQTSPVAYPESRHRSYDVFAFYEPCCETAEECQVHEQIQLVYDAYIQAIRLRLHENCRGRYLPGSDHASSCWQRGQAALDRLVQKVRHDEPKALDNDRAASGETATKDTVSSPQLGTRVSFPVAGRKRKRYGDKDINNSVANESAITNTTFAESLIEKAMTGMERVRKKKNKCFDPFEVQATVSRALELNLDGTKLDRLLHALEKAFRKSAKHAREEQKVVVWES
ncbi:hypothetical protein QBC44DRAFT_365078 [Cladorrhinum sp. PSN332]|nr:hypothetical protein QBC44DRAFT_365078 [Cladorrhinum sp. PSN332]